MTALGKVFLVGAGPGDPGLLTLRGAELLREADVVVCDALVNGAILRHAPSTVEIHRRGAGNALEPADIIALLIARARQGKRVVRLKGGDPYVFGRGGEEAEALHAAGIPFEVVPGVTSAVAVPSAAGIPVTHRGIASSFTVITGHEDPAKAAASVDLDRLAGASGTLVLLMGCARLRQVTARLIQAGLDPATPAAMIRQGTLPVQSTVVGAAGNIAERAEAAGITAPAVTVIGGVVRLRDKLRWFEQRPLFGRRVVVTRARQQAGTLISALEARGAEVLSLPTIRFGLPEEARPLLEAIAGLHGYDWLVFTSVNGVETFFGAFFKAFADMRDIGGVRIAAVGPATAARLRELRLTVDVTPKKFVARELARAMDAVQGLENLRVLLLRAEVATPELPRLLEDMGAIVDDIACYRTLPETGDPDGAGPRIQAEGADWITFTSASTVEHFNARFDLKDLRRRFKRLRCASIGPETSKALRGLGIRSLVEADPHTAEGLVSAIEAAVR
ncbi:MAG: uroporphyrinogen-III C-methyltransferase [Verrucomicrobiales bacterium]|nr:uroporphyrinogen-III C-methyltransferase [Verrucomicrobiales bacterium]MCP5525202.1 uroporphyrinogen-III C-methyltransferase [Verrucomicrobiales bacterium]